MTQILSSTNKLIPEQVETCINNFAKVRHFTKVEKIFDGKPSFSVENIAEIKKLGLEPYKITKFANNYTIYKFSEVKPSESINFIKQYNQNAKFKNLNERVEVAIVVDTDKIEKIEKKENKRGIKGMAYRFLKGDKIKNKNKIKKDKQELINNINKNIDDINEKIRNAMLEQIPLIFRYYSVNVFKEELNRVMKGAGSLMHGLYVDWQLPTIKEVQRKVTLKFNEATLKSLNEEVLDQSSEDNLGKISENFNKWKQDFDKNYISRIKTMLKLLIAMKWKKLISAAKKSISARGFARNVEKIPRIVLDPLKEHIENVFGNCNYDSVQKINNYISDFKNALPGYELKEIKNDTYEFFNSVYNRLSAAFADEYKDASALGKNVTNTSTF